MREKAARISNTADLARSKSIESGNMPSLGRNLEIAVILPCYNEEVAIAIVIGHFRQSLPNATIYVYDNNSVDRTAEIARSQGVIVRSETRQGKGFVVRRMFADVSADTPLLALSNPDIAVQASTADQRVSAWRGGRE